MPDPARRGSFGDVGPRRMTTWETFELWAAAPHAWQCTNCGRTDTITPALFSGILHCRVCGAFQTRPRVGNQPRP